MNITSPLGKTFAVTACCWSLCSAAQAEDQLDLGLSNEVITAAYATELRSGFTGQVAFLHSNANDRRSNLLSAGLGVSSDLNTIQPRIGAKLFALDGSHVNAYGLAIDAGVSANVAPNLWLEFAAAYAPDIVVGGDFNRYYELGAQVGYDILPRARVYLGYQDVQASGDGPDYEVYQGVVVGFKMKF